MWTNVDAGGVGVDETVIRNAVADFERWHSDQMRRIGARTRGLRFVILGGVGLLLAAGVVAWLF